MILLINICLDKLSRTEFVKPIENILKEHKIKFKTKHYLAIVNQDIQKAEKIIICGTALKDFGYLENINKFDWVKNSGKPILGICGGMQIIGKIFECKLINHILIGKFLIKATRENKLTNKNEFESYFLNSKAIGINKNFISLANHKNLDAIIKHKDKEVYSCLFHPEVLNQNIIINFCNQ